MKIAILGAGAMGMLFGGYLSQKNEVTLVDIDVDRVAKISSAGVKIREHNGIDHIFRPAAVCDSENLEQMDLVIVFVKSMYTESALQANRRLIGPDTYLMTLQNGAGHESRLIKFTDAEHIIIGSTQHNSSIIGNGYAYHGGCGLTSIGLLRGSNDKLEEIAKNFSACGFECVISKAIKAQIWNKLFTNTAASSLTAVLQVPLGFIYEDACAKEIMHALCREAVRVANAEGYANFDEQQVIMDVEEVCKNAPDGYTSIYADVKRGACSEVDTISGSVIDAAKEMKIAVPYHEMIVLLIHALEHKMKDRIS